MPGFDDRVFVVTGAAGGIGGAVSRLLVERGARVVLTDIDSQQGAAAAQQLESVRASSARFERLDVSDPAAIDALAKKLWDEDWGPYGVFANAGIAVSSAAVDYSAEDWRQTMGINLDGVFYSLRAFAAPLIDRERPGAFVVTSSIAGSGVVSPETHVAYGASKAAVAHLASLLGVEWAKNGVRVNAVAPGYTSTPILDKLRVQAPDVYQQWLDRIPVGRLNTPEEIAEAVVFLFSDNASGVTATTLAVDNGYSAR